MRLDLKPDWPEARQRFLAFWAGEATDRCCASIRAPKSPVETPPPADLQQFWLDPYWNLNRMLAEHRGTCFLAEAFPATTMCLGASAMAAFFGARPELLEETVWYHPAINDLATYNWGLDYRKGPLFAETFETTALYSQKAIGQCLVGLPELGSATDDLSLLRGMQELVYDMLDSPGAVHQAIGTLAKSWCELHTELFAIAKDANDDGCCIPWMQTWVPGPHYQMSCDFSSVLSPRLFQEFIVPELEAYLNVNEYSVYHLDGPDAVVHLDTLLGLTKLKAIQWTPGDGQPPTSDPRWWPIYHRVQDAGKRLILPFVKAEEAETLLANLSSTGLHISVWCQDENQAGWLLSKLPEWSKP